MRTRLMPTTHDQTVSQDRCILLYCILTGKSTNVGKCIEEELHLAAFNKKVGNLFFSSLITGLCLTAGTPHDPEESTVSNSAIITAEAITRLRKPLSGSSSVGFEQAMHQIHHRLDQHEQGQLQLTRMLQYMEQQNHQY